MTTKERILIEIESLPQEILKDVLKYIKTLKKRPEQTKKMPSFRLKGQFDDTDLRKSAYE